jgi:predicted RNA-binding Zn ribbon-like protein
MTRPARPLCATDDRPYTGAKRLHRASGGPQHVPEGLPDEARTPSLSLATIRNFRFIAGDAALDLVNTAAWSSAGPRNDRLGDYERLLRWATEARLIGADAEAGFRAAAARDPHAAAHAVEEARALRYLLRRLVLAATGVASARPPELDAEATVAEFDDYLHHACTHLHAGLRSPERPAKREHV